MKIAHVTAVHHVSAIAWHPGPPPTDSSGPTQLAVAANLTRVALLDGVAVGIAGTTALKFKALSNYLFFRPGFLFFRFGSSFT